MRRKDETTRGKLVDCAREIIFKNGADALNIRDVASMAGVASGTVYNYFSDKDELIFAVTEEFWREVISGMPDAVTADSFPECIVQMFKYLKEEVSGSAGLLMKSLGGLENAGRRRMATVQLSMGGLVTELINRDAEIPASVFNENFTKEKFADFVIMNIVAALGSATPDIEILTEAVRRIIY